MICIFHKWEYKILRYKSKHIDYSVIENYRRCKKCGKWQISIAMLWFDCNPPRDDYEEI